MLFPVLSLFFAAITDYSQSLEVTNIIVVLTYHWRELPQVSFLSRQTRVCRDKIKLVAIKLLLRQKFCHDKHAFIATKDMFVATKMISTCLSRQTFVATKMISTRIRFLGQNLASVPGGSLGVCVCVGGGGGGCTQ